MQLYTVAPVVTKRNKLLLRFLKIPTDFQYQELVKLLSYFGFHEITTGRTSGSRVRFENNEGVPIVLHKPHGNGIEKLYQLRLIKEILKL